MIKPKLTPDMKLHFYSIQVEALNQMIDLEKFSLNMEQWINLDEDQKMKIARQWWLDNCSYGYGYAYAKGELKNENILYSK